ncbi:MAG: hypothetical protein M5U34_32285 [Chloroflexi bacterium]|nr:hypothetical protein [Chloroflexota bacterium]
MNANGIGLAIDELESGDFLVTYLLENGPAAAAGIELGAELVAIDGVPINEAVKTASAGQGRLAPPTMSAWLKPPSSPASPSPLTA